MEQINNQNALDNTTGKNHTGKEANKPVRILTAKPFDALTIDTKNHAFVFDQSRSVFENDPGFDKKHWPDANFHTTRSRNYGGFMGANTGSDH